MTSEVEIVSILMFWHLLYFAVLPTSVSFENVASPSRLLGTEGQDLTMSCKAEGGTPAPNVILMIDGQTVASQIQSVQYTLNTINRSYDNKTVTCQASNPTYSQNIMTVSAVIYLNCKYLVVPVFSHIAQRTGIYYCYNSICCYMYCPSLNFLHSSLSESTWSNYLTV